MCMTIPWIIWIVEREISRAIISGRDTNSYAKMLRGFQDLVESLLELTGSVCFCSTPTDRNYRQIMMRIMNRRGHHIDEALVAGVRREIHHYVRPRSDRAGNFNVEHDFHIGVIGVKRIGPRVILSPNWMGALHHLGWR